MKRVFISDMHIGDGLICDNFIFDDELEQLLLNLSASGETTELVIVGDGLELMESKIVKDLGLVPFEELHDKIDPIVINHIVNNHPKVFNALSRFCRLNRLIYVIGNHDYYFHDNPKLQNRFKELIGTPENIEFVPYFYDKNWGVFAIHGNNFDPGNRFGKDKKGQLIPPIGDYMTRYMMIHFREVLINGDVPEHIPHDYDDVQPNMDVFEWFSTMMKTYDMGINLVELWMEELLKMLKTVQAKHWIKSNYPIAHRFSNLFINSNRGVKFGRILVGLVSKIRSLKRTNYMKTKARTILNRAIDNPKKYGFQERDFYGYCEMPNIDYENLRGLIFAHRHKFENYLLPSSGQTRFYINTGTWRTVIERDEKRKGNFLKRFEMAYVLIDDSQDQLSINAVTQNKIGTKVSDLFQKEVV
ncbi:MAG TPA: UDP-2,3-diacylglucosamine hydrolase [Thermotogota bacterium]|nr:UDP-2,3-diacylglucosamine hydrolase [Thermotogota bacterium]HRW33917.1 UDP-2,3-diacylglucosamine hydrolase [Thermotogota bacterium]